MPVRPDETRFEIGYGLLRMRVCLEPVLLEALPPVEVASNFVPTHSFQNEFPTWMLEIADVIDSVT